MNTNSHIRCALAKRLGQPVRDMLHARWRRGARSRATWLCLAGAPQLLALALALARHRDAALALLLSGASVLAASALAAAMAAWRRERRRAIDLFGLVHLARQADRLKHLPDRAALLAHLDRCALKAHALLVLESPPHGPAYPNALLSLIARRQGFAARLGPRRLACVLPLPAAGAGQAIDAVLRHGTGTTGLALAPRHGHGAALLKAAESALAQAQGGSARVVRYGEPSGNGPATPAPPPQPQPHELKEALRLGQFEMHYQARVDLRTGAAVGAEALLRWRHPTRGLLSPADFLHLARPAGIADGLAYWTLGEAIRQRQAWRQMVPGHWRVGVNLPSRHFEDTRLLSVITQLLAETGCPAGGLELEIVETEPLRAHRNIAATVKYLQALGFRVSLDDFGSGYSALNHLAIAPFDTIKIDRSCTRGIPASKAFAELVQGTIELAHRLRMSVVCEGIETRAQQSAIQAMGCDFGQGYLWCRPLPAPAFAAWLRGHPDSGPGPGARPLVSREELDALSRSFERLA